LGGFVFVSLSLSGFFIFLHLLAQLISGAAAAEALPVPPVVLVCGVVDKLLPCCKLLFIFSPCVRF